MVKWGNRNRDLVVAILPREGNEFRIITIENIPVSRVISCATPFTHDLTLTAQSTFNFNYDYSYFLYLQLSVLIDFHT